MASSYLSAAFAALVSLRSCSWLGWSGIGTPARCGAPNLGQLTQTDSEIALVVIRRHEQSESDIENHIKRRYRLTAAEMRLTLAMDSSRALRAVAEGLSITHETARTQIKAVFAKLVVSRQSELVAIMLRLKHSL